METAARFLILWSASLAMAQFAQASAGITYHGRLLKSDGTPVTASSVSFKIQVRTPGAENCLLYEEQQTKDLSSSKGVFALSINDGSATVVNTEPFTLDRAFQNRGSFNFGAGKCTGGTVYNPSPTDGRRLVVEFNDGSFGGWEQIPSQAINYVPMAIESMTVGGYNANNLLRVVDGAGAPTVVSPLTTAQHQALLDLANGTSTSYLSPSSPAAGFTGSLSGDVTGTQSATVVTKIQGRAVDTAAPSNGQALVWSAGNSRWEPGTVSGGGGDWSTLTGKPSTFTPSAHTHSVADITSGAGSYLTYQPNGVACSAGEVLKWETAGGGRWICGIDSTGGGGGAVNSVTGTSPVTVNNTDAANPVVSVDASVTSTNNSLVQRDGAGAIQSAGANFGSLQVNNGSSTITLGTPAAFASYVLKLPSGTGTNGQILTSNGTDMVWTTPSYMASVAASATGNVLTSNGTSWTSAALPIATGAARGVMQVGSGLAVSTGTVSADFGTGAGKVAQGNDSRFPSSTCGAGNKMRWDGSAWQCEATTDSTKVAKTGDTMSGSLTLSAGSVTVPANGLVVGADQLVASGGRVGIGTAAPQVPLDIFAGLFYLRNNDGGLKFATNLGQNFIQSAGAGMAGSADLHFTNMDAAATWMIIKSTGNVGVGTTAPAAKLDVAGEVKFGNSTSACDASKEGQQRYNSTSKKMEFCDGTSWNAYGTASGVSPPLGSIVAWHKSFANTPALPDGWVECNGQVLADAGSPYNGQTIPKLNSAVQDGTINSGLFLRGGTTSGTFQEDATAKNGLSITTNADRESGTSGGGNGAGTGNFTGATVTLTSTDTETRPANMTVVWIMRVK